MAEGSAITVKIGAETDGIEQGLKGIQNSLKNLESNTKASAEGFGNSFTGMAGAVAVGQLAVKAFSAAVDVAFSAARNVVQGFGDALDLGGRLSDLSASTGETAGKLLVLERAFDNSGIGAEKVGSSIAKMQKNIEDARDGSGTAANAFAAMGVSVDELEGKLPTEQFKILSSGIQSIDDPTQRAAAAMGVFGKSGAELLPLLTNLDGELAEARDTVGSMAEIMDRRNATFDAVGDRFKTIGEKVRDFAAGILDKALPAIDAITSALSRIDAAKIGQNLADAFLGGEKAMGGFQAAVDAFQTGQISAGLQVFWDSTKLQAAQTANEIYKRLIAAFQSAGQFLGEIFSPSGALIGTAISAFEMFGKRVASSIQRDLATTFEALPYGLGESMALALNDMANQSNTAANKIEDDLKGASGRIGEQFTQAGAALPKSFEENYAKVPPLFADLEGLQKSIEEQEKAIKKTAEETNAEREKTNEQLDAEKARRAEIAAQAAADADLEKANAVALVELETAINAAKAGGNEELLKSLESEKKRLEGQQEIAKLTEEYKTKLGVNADEAARLATNFVNAKDAAAGVAVNPTTVTEAKKEAAEAATAAKSFATWLDYIQGVDPSAPVKSLKEQTADARREITAFGEYIGTDLKNKSFPDIARELGIKNLGDTGTEQMNQILAHIASKRGELTGIQPIDEQGGKNSLQNIQAEITKLGTTQQPLNLDASASIESIKSKLKENIDLAITTGEGSKILGEIKTFVSEIKTLVGKIEPRLPVAALTA
jgi:hypothetical protein